MRTQQEMQNEKLKLIIENMKDGNTPINASIKDLETLLRINIELTKRLNN